MTDELPDQQMNILFDNKVKSFYSKPVQEQRKTQRQRVYDFVHTHGRVTQRMISEGTGIPRHLVPDRLSRGLKGFVKESGSIHDLKTKKDVTAYEII